MPWVLLPRLEYLHFEEYVRAVCFTSFLFHAVMELMAKVTQRKSRIVKQTKAVCFTNCSGLQWWTVQGCEQNQDQCTATKMHCSPVKQWLVMVPSSPYHTLPYHTISYFTLPQLTALQLYQPYHTMWNMVWHTVAMVMAPSSPSVSGQICPSPHFHIFHLRQPLHYILM